ncbi:MAG: hypothetical protein EBZ67_05025 [Chitinophagia bacterium]|nr:hypothetical protein [Chitinophagia bacterium]
MMRKLMEQMILMIQLIPYIDHVPGFESFTSKRSSIRRQPLESGNMSMDKLNRINNVIYGVASGNGYVWVDSANNDSDEGRNVKSRTRFVDQIRVQIKERQKSCKAIILFRDETG